jgi:hypothetical protein
MPPEKSGVHLTGADSGWPVGGPAEPDPKKLGDGVDPHTRADSVAGNTFEVSERQKLVVNATGGKYKLKLEGVTSEEVTPAKTAAQLKAILEAHGKIGAGNVEVTGGPGGAGGVTPYLITFKGALKDKDVPALEPVNLEVTGGAGTVVVTTVTPGS